MREILRSQATPRCTSTGEKTVPTDDNWKDAPQPPEPPPTTTEASLTLIPPVWNAMVPAGLPKDKCMYKHGNVPPSPLDLDDGQPRSYKLIGWMPTENETLQPPATPCYLPHLGLIQK
ncbi:uncharacterized protein CLUP02_14827 [Colletotrichum lupini]|uniref:Uncharacterized protein n=1 Tax=Colletotrichum lupini TaxID=145971 RepID=A0A9Q8T5I7_9PEZI|nr:uncharacterized protein CLUP02_14827 [Colletotrichum lupini]UQC89298.1 hypothetical protein CLUP02_14827 [Colletotrichum lupini]